MAAVCAFVNPTHAGGTMEVFCENKCAVNALTSGRVKDQVLAACARAMWAHAAKTDTDIRLSHTPGEGMALPDALSRASTDQRYEILARPFIADIPLKVKGVSQTIFNYSILRFSDPYVAT